MKIGIRCGEHLLENFSDESEFDRDEGWEHNNCVRCGESCGISCGHDYCKLKWVNDPYCQRSMDWKACTF